MDSPFLSVIVPIFNGEDHLSRTLDSLISSGIDKSFTTEVILVNDGSTDRSLSICEEYSHKYPGLFEVFSKDNGGQSSARNYGIEKAKGEYVYFLDDDDLLRPSAFSVFYENYFDDKYDILGFSSDTVNDSKDLVIEKGLEGSILFEGNGLDYLKMRTPTFVWVFWYKREFLNTNNLRFTIKYPEDALFNLMVFRLSPKVLITGQKVICYMNYQGEGQLTKNRNPKRMREIIDGYMSYFFELSNSRSFFDGDNTAVCLAMQSQIIPFFSRCLSSDLSIKEFRGIVIVLKQSNLLAFGNHNTRMTRVVKLIANSSILFPIYKLLYKRVFLRFILPKLSRG